MMVSRLQYLNKMRVFGELAQIENDKPAKTQVRGRYKYPLEVLRLISKKRREKWVIGGWIGGY